MCGRFTLTKTAREIAEAFSVSEPPGWQPKYNIAPTDWVLALVKSGSDRHWQLAQGARFVDEVGGEAMGGDVRKRSK